MATSTGSTGPSQSSPKPAKDATANAPATPELPLKQIGKYEIQKKIGAGGMGAVYLAMDSTLRRLCALKVLPQDKANNPTLVKRFKAEARSAANLRHDNIVSIYETGEADGHLYIALEYVEGTDVANLVHKRGVIPLKRSVEMVRQVTHALEHALQQGIVHRDIKPGNLLVRRDGVVKLADLGLARSIDEAIDTSITRAGTTVGTVDYMSPEQARDSKAADVRSDIYSLGCTWYYMLTGEPPFSVGNLTNKLRAHAETPIPDPRTLNPAVSEAVFGVLRRMTEKKPSQRYQTPQELLEDLDAASLNGNLVSDTILSDMPTDENGDDDSTSSTSARQTGRFDGGTIEDDAVDGRRNRKRRPVAPQEEEYADDGDPEERSRNVAGRKAAEPEDDGYRPGKRQSRDKRQADEEPEEFEGPETTSRPEKKPKASKRSVADEEAGPAFKPPPGRDRDKDKLLEPEQPKRNNTALVYALTGLFILAMVAGIIPLVLEFGVSSDPAQPDRMGNPFANQAAVGKNAGPGAGAGKPGIGGNAATGAATNSADGSPGNSSIGSSTPGGGPESAIGGSNGPVVDQGSVTTRIGGDSNIGAGDRANPGGTNASGIGGSATGTGGSPATAGNSTIGGSSIGGSSTGGSVGGNASSGNSSSGKSGTAAKTGPGSRASSPQIETRIKQETAFLAAVPWAGQPRPTGTLATLIVQSGGSGDGKFATLNQALEQVPAAGALIKLSGNGPFPLSPIKIADKTRIVIEPLDLSNAASAPIIVLDKPKEETASSFLEFSNTPLDLRRVHLVLDAASQSTAGDDALLSAVSSDLFLQNCSLTVKGLPDSPLTAIRVTGKVQRSGAKANPQPRVLIDNSFIRGNHLTAVVINSEHVDLVARNSLIWSGKATALRFGAVARSDADSARDVRLVSTTLCSQTCAVQIAGDASQPVPTSIELFNSLAAAPAHDDSKGSDSAMLLNMEGWNQNQQKTAFGKFIHWKSTASLYTGWKTLIRLNPGDIAAANSLSQWQAAWKDKAPPEKDQFQAALWPGRSIADIATATDFDALAPQTVGKQYVKTGEGGWPGCQTERLNAVSVESLGPVRLATTRPVLPRGLFQSPVRDILRVDVTREDLGKVIERKDLQNGTQIIAVGSGVRQSSPIVIENAWVRLQFEQAEGPPLVLVPKAGDSKNGDSKYDGFISVVNGGIEIIGGAFTTPASERQTIPKWFIQVIDGDLAMWHCRVQGALNGAPRNQGLIQILSRSGRPPQRLFEGSCDGYAWFDSCFLAGSGTMIEADTRRRALVVKNCVVVSRDDLFTLNVGEPDSEIGSAVDVSYSTLSATDCFFQVRGGDLGSPSESPLRLYADRCLFAPPLRNGQQQKVSPTLLSYAGPVLAQKQLTWWEKRCGYAPEITRYLRSEAEKASIASQDFEKVWLNQWGTEHVLEPLLGVNGVVLEKELPTRADERNKLEPGDFQLQSGCRAAIWDAKRPIGAYLSTMQIPLLKASAVAAAEKKKPVKAAPPSSGTSAPGF